MPGTTLSAFNKVLSDFTGDRAVVEAITSPSETKFQLLWCITSAGYQGTFLRMSNLTASASMRATITAQTSSESHDDPVLKGTVVDLSVAIGTFSLINSRFILGSHLLRDEIKARRDQRGQDYHYPHVHHRHLCNSTASAAYRQFPLSPRRLKTYAGIVSETMRGPLQPIAFVEQQSCGFWTEILPVFGGKDPRGLKPARAQPGVPVPVVVSVPGSSWRLLASRTSAQKQTGPTWRRATRNL